MNTGNPILIDTYRFKRRYSDYSGSGVTYVSLEEVLFPCKTGRILWPPKEGRMAYKDRKKGIESDDRYF